jgi:hypothetical protein
MTALWKKFQTGFRRGWRLWWGLWAAPFVGTYREVVRSYQEFSNRGELPASAHRDDIGGLVTELAKAVVVESLAQAEKQLAEMWLDGAMDGVGQADIDKANAKISEAALRRSEASDALNRLWVHQIKIESMTNAEKRELMSSLRELLRNLLKWQHQPVLQGIKRQATIRIQRRDLGRFIKGNPSLQKLLGEVLSDAYEDAVIGAVADTGFPVGTFSTACPWSFDEIMDTKFWPDNTMKEPPP